MNFLTLFCCENQILNNLIMKKRLKKLFISLIFFSFMGLVSAQETNLTGTVTQSDGNPIPGVSVVVKSTSVGTVTDMNGRFSIISPVGSKILVFSFIGMKTKEVEISSSSEYNVVLEEDVYNLEEVVAIGYGTMRKMDLTGSVASVKSENINAFPTTNVVQALQGRAAGVQIQQNTGAPGATMQVRVRGTNSIIGSNEPLWVIDGFPGDQSMFNNSDIESVEILKDASATAIYGSRGANGVIIVTTKKGKAGISRVDYEGSFSMQTLRKELDLLNSKEYAQLVNLARTNDKEGIYFTQEEIDNFGEGTDWQSEIFRNAPVQQHHLSFSGGNDKTRFLVSAGYFDQTGIIENSDYRRINLKANIEHQFSKKFKVIYNSVLSRNDDNDKDASGGNRGGSLISAIVSAAPTLTAYNDDGTYRLLAGYYPFSSNVQYNPTAYVNEITNKSYSNKVNADLALIYEPIKDLTIKVSGNVLNIDSRTDNYTTTKYPTSSGSAYVGTSQNLNLRSDNIITYIKTINDIHSFNLMGGFTYENSVATGLSASGNGFLSDVTETYNLGSAANFGTPSTSFVEWTLLSYLGRINYSFKNKYLFTASIRADGSSRYSEENKWGYFPSGAFAWRVSEEGFLKDNSIISDLKFRISYGETGSTAISPYYTLEMLGSGKTTFGEDLYTYFVPGTRLPADLKWETTAQSDVGFDLGIFDNRIRLTGDYYIKNTTNLLNNVQLPASLGYTTTVQNVGEIRNQGIELQLDANIFNGEFKWDVSGNFSLNRNEVIKLYNGQDILGMTSSGLTVIIDNYNILREGHPFSAFYGYQEDGYDDQGRLKFKDNDGVEGITAADKTFIGDPNPDFIYGFNSNMSWKNLELSFFIQGSQGNDIMSWSMVNQTLDYGIGLNTLKEVLYDNWSPENLDAKYPIISRYTQPKMSDRFVYDGSYVRLKNIQLAYNVPVNGIQWLGKAQIYISGQNLLTVTSYPWWDPEVNSWGGGNSINQGIDWYSYPTPKGVTMGVKLSF